MKGEPSGRTVDPPTPPEIVVSGAGEPIADEETGLGPYTSRKSNGSGQAQSPQETEETELQIRSTPTPTGVDILKQKASQVWDRLSVSGSQATARPLNPKLAALVNSYASSEIAASVRVEIAAFAAPTDGEDAAGATTPLLPDVEGEVKTLRNRTRASWGTQFTILSGRAFKNLYRDPALLFAHYATSIVIACALGCTHLSKCPLKKSPITVVLCGGLFHNVTCVLSITANSCN